MNLYDYVQVFFEKYCETAAFHTYVTVKTMLHDEVIWAGKISDLYKQITKNSKLGTWGIVEVIVDYSRKEECNLPPYNKSKIIKVF